MKNHSIGMATAAAALFLSACGGARIHDDTTPSYRLYARLDNGRLAAALVNESTTSLVAYGNRVAIFPEEAGFALEIQREGGGRARFCGMLDQAAAEVAELAPGGEYHYHDQVEVIRRDYCLQPGKYHLHVVYRAPALSEGAEPMELARSERLDFRVE